MQEKTKQFIEAGLALEKAMSSLPTVPCPCVMAELLEDFTIEDIKAIATYQARMCALLGERFFGGDVRANEHLVHVLERRKQLESSDIFNDENLEK